MTVDKSPVNVAAMYTRLARPPQTAWARHLDAVRVARDWSATQMFEDAREALGLAPKSRTAFTSLLIDDEPNERQAKALAQLYGMPEPEPERSAPDPDALTAILQRQVAINELLVARLDALEQIVASLSRPGVDRDAVAQSLDAAAHTLASLPSHEPSPPPEQGQRRRDKA